VVGGACLRLRAAGTASRGGAHCAAAMPEGVDSWQLHSPHSRPYSARQGLPTMGAGCKPPQAALQPHNRPNLPHSAHASRSHPMNLAQSPQGLGGQVMTGFSETFQIFIGRS
jgi:hypothetical protein